MGRIGLRLVLVATASACGDPENTCDAFGGEDCYASNPTDDSQLDDTDGPTHVDGPFLTAQVTADNGVTPYTLPSGTLFGSMSQTQLLLPVEGDEGGTLTIAGSASEGSQVVGDPGSLTSFVFDDPAHFGSTGNFQSVSGSLDVSRF